MTPPFKIGVLQLSMEPLNETVHMSKACDAAGFDTFWLAEAYPWWRKHSMEARSSTAITAIIARNQENCNRVGHHLSLHASPRADRYGSSRFAGSRRPGSFSARSRRLQDLHERNWRRRKGQRSRPRHGDARKHRNRGSHARRP